MIGNTWDPTASMSTMKYFLTDHAKHKSIVHQLDFIGHFYKPMSNIEFLRIWTVDMKNNSQSIPTILEDQWG